MRNFLQKCGLFSERLRLLFCALQPNFRSAYVFPFSSTISSVKYSMYLHASLEDARRSKQSARLVTCFCFALSLVFVPAQVWADKQRFQAAFSIVNPLKMSQSSTLDFGGMRMLPGESCYLDPVSGRTEGSACYATEGQLARILVEGSSFESAEIAVSVEENAALVFAPELNRVSQDQSVSRSGRPYFLLEIGGKVSLPETFHIQDEESTLLPLAYAVEIVYP